MVGMMASAPEASQRWIPDTELAGFQQLTLPLPEAKRYSGESDADIVATLVRREEPQRPRAMLYLHGWNDYFFQRHLADEVADMDYDFYALDLRRYGRSLRTGLFAGFTTDLRDYFQELDKALAVIKAEGHPDVVFMGHSTGGLVGTLWADQRPGELSAVVLNAPWIELQGNAVLRPMLTPMMSVASSLSATSALIRNDNGFYRRAISADEEGRWGYNPNLKGDKAFVVRVGWMSAIMTGHAMVEDGLSIDVPVLVCLAERSDFSVRWSEELRRADIVLDVDRLAERVHDLGNHVTLIRIPDAMHDLALSDEPALSQYLAEVRRWLSVYG